MIDIERVNQLKDSYKAEKPHWRIGQCLFNAIWKLYPKAADKMRGSEADPFYADCMNDERVKACYLELKKMKGRLK